MKAKQLIITVEESDSSIGFYDSETGLLVSRIKTGFWPHEIEVSADGKTAFVTNFGIKDYDEHIGHPGSSISVIDIENKCETHRLFTFNNKEEHKNYKAPHGIKLHPNGKQLYVNVEGEDEEMLIFDLDTPNDQPGYTKGFKIDQDLHLHDDHFDIPEGTHNFIFSTDGEAIFLGSGKKGLFKVDAYTGQQIAHIPMEGKNAVRGIAFSYDQQSLIVSCRNEILIVSPETLTIEKKFNDYGVSQLLYSKPSPDGKYIIAPAVWESKILVIDYQTGELITKINVGADPIHVAFKGDGRSFLVSHGRSSYISEIAMDSFTETRRIQTQGGPNGMSLVPFSDQPEQVTLKIGACLPLSGPNATEGRAIRLGYQFWQENTNKTGGLLVNGTVYKIEVVYRDTESKSKGHDTFLSHLAKDLIENEKVQFMFGGYPTPPHMPIGKVCNQYKIPLLTATGAGEIIYNQGYDNLYGIMSPARVYLSGVLETIMDHTNTSDQPKTLLFISCNDPAALEDATQTAAFGESLGLKLITPPESEHYEISSSGVVKYDHDNYDLDAVVNDLKTVNVDLIFNTGHLPESIALTEALKKHEISAKGFAFSVGPTVPKFRAIFKETALNLFGSAQWNVRTELIGHDEFITPKKFANEFYNRFSMEASYFSAGGYACGIVLKNAIRRANTLDFNKVNSALKTTKLSTFFADIQFDHRGLNDDKPIISVQIQKTENGEIVEIPLRPKSLSGNNEAIYPFPGWQ